MNTPTRLLVVMDPIDHIKYQKDTTLALLLAARAHGHALHYAELADLRLRDGVAEARTRALAVRADPQDWHALGEPVVSAIGDFDVVLMRKDPPFDTEYIYASYILERAELAGALVVNRPRGLRDMNEKVYTAWFPQCCAPTLVTRDMAEMAAFAATHGTIVCKPLHGMGGRSIFVLPPGDKNSAVVYETLTDYGQRFAIAQAQVLQFGVVELVAVHVRRQQQGQRRVLLVLDVIDRIHHHQQPFGHVHDRIMSPRRDTGCSKRDAGGIAGGVPIC